VFASETVSFKVETLHEFVEGAGPLIGASRTTHNAGYRRGFVSGWGGRCFGGSRR
jgi:hypothetical protein